MKGLEEAFAKHVASAAEGPLLGLDDVELLDFVQLVAQRDVGGDQRLPLLLRQRRVAPVIAGEEIDRHRSSQRYLGLPRSRSSTSRSRAAARLGRSRP